MIRAIMWKELREQGMIGLALVVLGSGVLVATAMLADPPTPNAPPADVIRFLGAGLLATLMLAVTAGMVCGGALFAAEREAGTMAFLESLPASRWRLWWAKFTAGLGLTVVQITVLVAVAAGLGLVQTPGWAFAISTYAFLAFVWGMFGSTTARTTLGSVGLAIPVAILTALGALIPVVLFFQNTGSALPRRSGGVFFVASMFLVPVGLSAWLFTGPDRARRAEDGRRPRRGIAALQWLVVRQSWLSGLVISAFAVLMGLCLLAPGIQPFMVWPELALAAGVLAGVTAFADEQTHGSARFWAEQRLPLGRAWAIKIGTHLMLCGWFLLLLVTPLVIRSQFLRDEGTLAHRAHSTLADVFGCPLLGELGRHGWRCLLVPAVYGFATGHLCGLLFRKLVVASGVAAVIGGVGAAAWIPSLLAGGVKHWQLWLPPLVALATARLLLRPWAADQLVTRRPLGTLVGGSLAAVLALIAGLGYRVLEVPDSPRGEDDLAYVAGLVPFDENLGGRDFKTAAERYLRMAAATSPEFDRSVVATPSPAGGRRLSPGVEERLDAVPRVGWPENDPELGAWLDLMFTSRPPESEEIPWHALVAIAAELPVGIYEHPQLLGPSGVPESSLQSARRMSVALLARGLQKQATGDPGVLIVHLRVVLSLARTLRNKSVVSCLQTGLEVERLALIAFDRWLERSPPPVKWFQNAVAPFDRIPVAALLPNFERPDLFRVLALQLEAGDSTEPFDPTSNFLAERYVLREAMKAPTQWLPSLITPGERGGISDPAIDLVGLAWTMPWERERTRRLVGLGFEEGPTSNLSLVVGRPGIGFFLSRNRTPDELIEVDRQLRALRRAMILKLALRAFRAERGNYPNTLAELVSTGYLHRLPVDPYDDARGFGYRISPGETLRSTPRTPSDRVPLIREEIVEWVVPGGQAILWSVGPDRIDQGGTNPPRTANMLPTRTNDLVYLVPTGTGP